MHHSVIISVLDLLFVSMRQTYTTHVLAEMMNNMMQEEGEEDDDDTIRQINW